MVNSNFQNTAMLMAVLLAITIINTVIAFGFLLNLTTDIASFYIFSLVSVEIVALILVLRQIKRSREKVPF